MSDRLRPIAAGITFVEPYVSVRRGGPPTKRFAGDPNAQRAMLEEQLGAIFRSVANRRPEDRDPDSRNELIVVRPKPGEQLDPEGLGDKRTGTRVVAVDQSGAVYLDAANPYLPHLHRKAEAYTKDSLVSEKTGARRHEHALAPIGDFHLATFDDLIGDRLRVEIGAGEVVDASLRWFELGCRGGGRERTIETDRSRDQIKRTLQLLKRRDPVEFLAPEQVVFYVRLTLAELQQMVERVDCVFELDLAPPPVRDWLLFSARDYPLGDLATFRMTPPRSDAPAVAVLDTGIASSHPMLASALLAKHSVVPEDLSPEDGSGHGTMMAGVALYPDVGAIVEANGGTATHWLESVRLLTRDGEGSAADSEAQLWPVITARAIRAVEASGTRRRVYALAVTAPLDKPEAATTWSQAVDQLAYNNGDGRLFCVSIGNCDPFSDTELAQGYPRRHLEHRLEQPAQAINVLTIGAYTQKTLLPPDPLYNAMRALAPEGGVSPSTRAGCPDRVIKPDLMFEGGNAAFDGVRASHGEETLSVLTTGRDVLRRPLAVFHGTSPATGHAARFLAEIWRLEPEIRPATVRGLAVHSARWTHQMIAQWPDKDERLAMCGYGVPSLSRAAECLRARATIMIEDEMPNAVETDDEDGETKTQRVVKYFRLPQVVDAAEAADEKIELAVTLSYFAEPSTFRRHEQLGLRLAWNVQGPGETEESFQQRINKVVRDAAKADGTYEQTQGFSDWVIGPLRRERGTVQSDRVEVAAPWLGVDRLVAVYPVLGWWEARNDTRFEVMPFSLIVSVEAVGLDLYTPISSAIAMRVKTQLEVTG